MSFIGLNTINSLSDIQDKEESLRNLGINPNDLRAINGLGDRITRSELQLASGLDVDQKAELFSLSSSISAIENEITDIRDIRFSQEYNFNIDNQIRARAIKYNFLEKDQNGKASKSSTNLRSADISTSRVSSWSSTVTPAEPTDPIFYGGDLEITGNLNAQSIQILSTPEERKYSAELPTHLITIRINGEDKQFYAMKGIPLRFRGFFRIANLFHSVEEISGVNPVWKIINVDVGGEFEFNSSTEATVKFRDRFSRLRDIEFYYDPRSILELDLSGLLIDDVTLTQMNSLERYNLSINNLVDTPNFQTLTPNLIELNLRGNNLSRSADDANTQMQRLPTSLQILNISGCFQEETELDFTYLTSLKTLLINSYYGRNRRRFLGNLNSPRVASSIETYNIRSQPAFTTLDASIEQALNLRVLDIDQCNIASNSNGNDIELSTNSLEVFSSEYNSHNVIDVSNQTTLRSYSYRYSSINNARDSSIEDKFTGCTNLESINFYRTNATGSVNTAFQGLTELESIDIRRTQLSGQFNSASFAGTEKLRFLYIEGGNFSGNLFSFDALVGLSDLRRIIVQNNRNVNNSIPDFSRNARLERIYIRNTSITGTPNLSQNANLRYVYMDRNELNGEAPSLKNNRLLITAIFSDNNFTGNLPIVVAPNLRTLDFRNNQLNGSIPDLSQCIRLRQLRLASNNLSGYTAGNIDDGGSLAKCVNLREVDISNNNLKNENVFAIIRDMHKTYQQNPRSGVTINLLGNPDVSENTILENETIRPLVELLRNKGWIILI